MPVLLQARREHRLIEQVVETVIQAVGYKGADGEKGEQFDQRLEGNRQHHAAVVFGGIEVARAKYNGKQRQHQGHNQCGVLGTGACCIRPGPYQQIDAEHNAL